VRTGEFPRYLLSKEKCSENRGGIDATWAMGEEILSSFQLV
jgi:hypothetical protein